MAIYNRDGQALTLHRMPVTVKKRALDGTVQEGPSKDQAVKCGLLRNLATLFS